PVSYRQQRSFRFWRRQSHFDKNMPDCRAPAECQKTRLSCTSQTLPSYRSAYPVRVDMRIQDKKIQLDLHLSALPHPYTNEKQNLRLRYHGSDCPKAEML